MDTDDENLLSHTHTPAAANPVESRVSLISDAIVRCGKCEKTELTIHRTDGYDGIMEQKIGIIVNPIKCLREFCARIHMEAAYKLVVSADGQMPSASSIMYYRLIVHNANGE